MVPATHLDVSITFGLDAQIATRNRHAAPASVSFLPVFLVAGLARITYFTCRIQDS
jgi:hypothetical protein